MKLTQAEFGNMYDYSDKTISAIETGRSNPSRRLIRFLKLEHGENFGLEEPKSSPEGLKIEEDGASYAPHGPSPPADEWCIHAVKQIFMKGDYETIHALKANIRQFESHIRSKEEIEELKREMRRMQKRIDALEMEKEQGDDPIQHTRERKKKSL